MRVEAIESAKDRVVRSYGLGDMTHEIPDITPFKDVNAKNACIKLDSGKYVWGFQCWWGPVESMKKLYPEDLYQRILVEIPENEEVKPISTTPNTGD